MYYKYHKSYRAFPLCVNYNVSVSGVMGKNEGVTKGKGRWTMSPVSVWVQEWLWICLGRGMGPWTTPPVATIWPAGKNKWKQCTPTSTCYYSSQDCCSIPLHSGSSADILGTHTHRSKHRHMKIKLILGTANSSARCSTVRRPRQWSSW